MRDHRKGLETPRLRLRAFEPGDAQAFFEINSHPEVMRFTGEQMCSSLAEAAEAIASYPDWKTHGIGRWAAVYKSQQRVIGFAGLKVLPELGGAVDLGYRLLPSYWGLGLATEASVACVRYGFEVLGLERIIGLVLARNKASCRVLEKTGMTHRGQILFDDQNVELYEIFSPGPPRPE